MLLLPTLLVLSLLLAGCGGAAPEDGAAARVLRVGIEDRPKTLDPRHATDASGQRIARHLIFNSLVQHDYDLSFRGDLATGWETPDPTTWVFPLRRDAVFHDGEPFDATDVVATFEHLMDPATQSPYRAELRDKIAAVEATDPHTVRFTLHRPTASFLPALVVSILPAHLLATEDAILVGTGPFKLASTAPQEIVLAPHAEHHGGAPRLDRLVFKVLGDENTRFLKLRKGEIDVLINALPLHKIDDVKKPPLADRYRLIEEPGISYNYLAFNFADPVFQSLELRRAIAHAIDVDEIITHRLYGHAVRATGLLSPASAHYEGDVATYAHDPEQARALLDEAGFEDPDGDGPEPRLTLELKTSNRAETVSHARILQAQLARVGIRLELRSYEWGTFYGDVTAGNFQLTLMRWVGASEPDFFYEIFHSSQTPPGGRNRGRYDNPEMDALVEAGRVELDPQKRREIYAEVQRIAASDLPYVSLWHLNNVAVVHRRVEGYRQHPKAGFFSFQDVVLD